MSGLRRLIDRAQAHPVVLGLVLLGGVAGGVTALTGTGAAVLDWMRGDGTVAGRVCPILFEDDCLTDNQKFADNLPAWRDGENLVELDLAIDWGGLDQREELCGDAADLDGLPPSTHDVASGWTVLAVPVSEESCDADLFLAFRDAEFEAGLVSSGGGGSEYRIIGTFFVSAVPLAGPASAPDIDAVGFTAR